VDYVTVRELRAESGKVWERVAAGEEIVVTRNGKPFALLLHTEPSGVEAALRAYRAARFGAVLERIQTYAEARGLDRITAKEIEAEIATVRKERQAADAKSRRR
jgi:prevent-host-death family protein